MITSQVARFISARIEASGYSQKYIATLSGFERPNIITMIRERHGSRSTRLVLWQTLLKLTLRSF